ncbi:MAG: serine/threonine protein kinase, bacterial [Thermoleophilaceae bacterium]|jgi:serine/threonine-protein kinase|nr:serine/threonine protein kinase, bacterial [Thermoleophilaceae bacterium]
MSQGTHIAAGERVGPYRIDALLGEGGMAHVYRAVGPGEREVALKLVKPDLATDEEFRRRFRREARAAATVHDSHVVSVIDEGLHDGVPYLVQELIRGGSLAARLRATGRLEVGAFVTLCLQVASGLDALHRAGMVHRDVKPENILLDEAGSAHVADFGLVKNREGSVLTKPGQTVGSVDYMAPEQIRGEEVTAATDTYALGCVAYECLVGSPPFADRQGMRIMWAHLQDEAPDPCSARPDLPLRLGLAVRMALQKEPGSRPPTATAYARMIQAGAGVAQ